MPPGPRAGFSMCIHKKRAVLFGGVVDMEVKGEILSCRRMFVYLLIFFFQYSCTDESWFKVLASISFVLLCGQFTL